MPCFSPVLQPSDPVLVGLDELARRAQGAAPDGAAHRFNNALRKAFPEASTSVYNRAKDGLAGVHRDCRLKVEGRSSGYSGSKYNTTAHDPTVTPLASLSFLIWSSCFSCSLSSSWWFDNQSRLNSCGWSVWFARTLQDPGTKRYKFPQLFNDFSLALTKAAMDSTLYATLETRDAKKQRQ